MIQLEPRYKKGTKVYQLDEDFELPTGIKGFSCTLKKVSIDENGRLVIRRNYTWDGCTPKFSVFGMIFGTPEGELNDAGKPKTFIPSLVHDALYQLSGYTFDPQVRRVADRIFYDLLKRERFMAAKLYHLAVEIFGKYYWG